MKRALEGVSRFLRSPAAIYLAASVLARGGSILLIPAYTRQLDEAAYGDYALVLTLVAGFPVLFTLGTSTAIPRVFFRHHNPTEARRETGAVGQLHVLLTVTGATLAFLVGMLSSNESGNLRSPRAVALIICAIAGAALATVPDTWLRTAQRPVAAALFQLTQFTATVGAGIVLVRVLGRGLWGALEALAVANGIAGLVGALFVFGWLRGTLTVEKAKAALSISVPLLPHLLAGWLTGTIDRWVLKSSGLHSALGLYALASQLAVPAAMAITAWNDAESASTGAAFRDGGATALLNRRSVQRRGYLRVSVGFGLAIGFALPLFAFALGERFRSALPLVPVFLAINVVESLYYPSSNVLYFLGKTRALSTITVITSVLNVGLNALAIPVFGLWGAFAARAVSATFRSVAVAFIEKTALSETRHPASAAP